ncbi:MAG: hypothetical protein K5884_00420 [Ruminococcus sp.]|nr:hypothetical protein [Ruminococcus sp.]
MMRPDWDKITDEAFNSEEVHDFSADYCRRRAELQGGTSMEKRRITQKTRRFNTRIAATAAALLVIPTATVGVLHFAPSGDNNDGKQGAAVEETTAVVTATETVTATEIAPSTENIYGEEVTAVTTAAVTEALTNMAETETETAVAEEAATGEEMGIAVTPLDSDDPSYLKGNYQMVFRDHVPEGFVGIEGGVLCYDPPTNDNGASITPSWFYNVNGSYKKVFSKYENEMEYTGTITYNTAYGARECDIFRSTTNGDEKYLIKFENTNFVGVLDITEGVENEAIDNFISQIQIMTKAQLEEEEDVCLLVGGPSTNGPSDPEAAMEDSDVFRFSAQVEMVYDVKVNHAPAGYNLGNHEGDSWIYSNPSDGHAIYFTIYNYGGEMYKQKLQSYLTSNSVNDFLDHTDIYIPDETAACQKVAHICYRKEGPYKTETQEEWNERKAKGWDNRDVIVFNGDTDYAVGFTVNDHMSDEELKKVIDGIEFVKRDTPEKTTNYLPWFVSGEAK